MTGSADIRWQDCGSRQEPGKVLLVKPTWFDVVDVKNPYMEGSRIDRDRAVQQWEELCGIYQKIVSAGLLEEVVMMEGAEGLEDMVFCANQSLPWKAADGRRCVVISRMHHDSRQREVAFFRDFYTSKGYSVRETPTSVYLEGMGDAIYHPYRRLVWMGHGFRSSANAADFLRGELDMPVIPLSLVSGHFYHLDTCFLPLREDAVLICEEAFDPQGLKAIRSVFDEVMTVSLRDAKETFSLNTHCIYHPEHPVAVMPAGARGVKEHLMNAGYTVYSADTSEFIKSGGSVYCMKMMMY